jgi:ABC-type transport system substrate-binding protein
LILSVALGDDGVWGGPPLPVGFGDWVLPDAEIQKLFAPNIKDAKALLQAAGIQNLTVEAQYSNIDATATAEFPLIKQSLAQAGINFELKPLERTIYLDNQVKSNFSFQGIGVGGYPDPDNYLYPNFHSKGTKNYGKVNDPELDKLIDQQRRILDTKERHAFINDMQRKWKSYLYRTYTANPNRHTAWLPEVRGTFNTKGWDWKGLEGVWLA